MVSPSSHNSWLISWGHSTVGVGNQSRDTSKGTSIADGTSSNGGGDGTSVANSWSNWGNSWASNQSWAREDGSIESSALSQQVVSPSCSNSWLICWGHCTVGVGNQSRDTSKGTSIADGTSSNGGGDGTSVANSWSNWGNSWASNQSWAREDGSVEGSALSPQVVSPGSHNSWLICWGHSTVGVGNQSWDTSKGTSIADGT